jgi:hypothetical protein
MSDRVLAVWRIAQYIPFPICQLSQRLKRSLIVALLAAGSPW